MDFEVILRYLFMGLNYGWFGLLEDKLTYYNYTFFTMSHFFFDPVKLIDNVKNADEIMSLVLLSVP